MRITQSKPGRDQITFFDRAVFAPLDGELLAVLMRQIDIRHAAQLFDQRPLRVLLYRAWLSGPQKDRKHPGGDLLLRRLTGYCGDRAESWNPRNRKMIK